MGEDGAKPGDGERQMLTDRTELLLVSCLWDRNALRRLSVLGRIRFELLRTPVAAEEIAPALVVCEHLVLGRLGHRRLDSLHRALDLSILSLA